MITILCKEVLKLGFKRLDANLNIHQSLPDKPTLTAEELKEKFDEAGNVIKDYINNIFLAELEAKGVFIEGNNYVFPKKIIAQEGVEGNVKGDVTGNCRYSFKVKNTKKD